MNTLKSQEKCKILLPRDWEVKNCKPERLRKRMERGSVKSLGAGWDSKGKGLRAGAGAFSCLSPSLAQKDKPETNGKRQKEEGRATC